MRQVGLNGLKVLLEDSIPPVSSFDMFDTKTPGFQPEADRSLNNYLCSICFFVYADPVATSCGHMFCRICLEQSLKVRNSCPYCCQTVDSHVAVPQLASFLERHFAEEVQKSRIKAEEPVHKAVCLQSGTAPAAVAVPGAAEPPPPLATDDTVFNVLSLSPSEFFSRTVPAWIAGLGLLPANAEADR